MKKKKNLLFEKIRLLLTEEKHKGELLDIGCGDGDFSKMAYDVGFNVIATDLNPEKFKYNNLIPFRKIDLTSPLPFTEKSFDYILFLEVIEHLENPSFVLKEFSRILKQNGCLYLSTPNILNLRSRLRFLMQGSFDFFREPPLEIFKKKPSIHPLDIHLTPFRIHELEYILYKSGLVIEMVSTDIFLSSAKALFFLLPIIDMQMNAKQKRAIKKGGDIDYAHIHRLLSSPELLYGRHLIIKARRLPNSAKK